MKEEGRGREGREGGKGREEEGGEEGEGGRGNNIFCTKLYSITHVSPQSRSRPPPSHQR